MLTDIIESLTKLESYLIPENFSIELNKYKIKKESIEIIPLKHLDYINKEFCITIEIDEFFILCTKKEIKNV